MRDNIPEEILINILVKFPVKSLIRLTGVRKSWRSIIRSPFFIRTHLSNTESESVLCRYGLEAYPVFPESGPFGITSPEFDFPFERLIGYYRIVGSCDGLLCLSNHDVNGSTLPPAMIWNPAIRNHVVLPKPLVNPTEIHTAVLGFGVAGKVYKVVRLVRCRIFPSQAEVFSLGTGRWRRLSDVSVCVIRFMVYPIFFGGIVHWIEYVLMGENVARNLILRFHVGDEVFGETMLPEELERANVELTSLALLGESLAAIKYDGVRGDERCDVWMMEDYGLKEPWTKLYRIDSVRFHRVVGFWGNGEALLEVDRRKLCAYNADTKGIKQVEVFGNYKSKATFYMDRYKESLVLLGGYNGESGEDLSAGAEFWCY